MTNVELAKVIRQDLFADKNSIKEAYDYAFSLINSIRASDRTAALTALMVVANTIAKEILKNEESK
jgi:hypothetical protein